MRDGSDQTGDLMTWKHRMAKKTSNKAKKFVAKRHPAQANQARTKKPAVAAAVNRGSRPAALGKREIRKIQELLKSKRADGVAMGLSLLESLGASVADYESVLTDRVISIVVSEKKLTSATVQRWEALVAVIREAPTLLSAFAEKAAIVVARQTGELDLSGLISLSPEVAEALANQKPPTYLRTNLILNGLTTLDAEAAAALAKRKPDGSGESGMLYLKGLQSLTPEAAEALAQCRGWIWLDGVTTLSDGAAEALAKCKVPLGLDGVTSLSDTAAESLAQHEHYLSLKGLSEMSDTVARSLAQRKAQLKLHGERTKISQMGLLMLKANPQVDLHVYD